MNGRIYDPLLGRFLSADVVVQYPSNLQSYNRYSYVRNNPLSLTDPTGFQDADEADSPANEVDPDILENLKVEAKAEARGPSRFTEPAEGPLETELKAPGTSGNAMRPLTPEGQTRIQEMQNILNKLPNSEPAEAAKTQVEAKADQQSTAPKPQVETAKAKEVSSDGQMEPQKNSNDTGKGPDTTGLSKGTGDWKGKADYSGIKNPKNVDASTRPTPRQAQQMKQANKEQNSGVLRDDKTGEPMVDSAKSQKGVTPPANEAQVDHIIPVNAGGTRDQGNLELRTRANNRAKSDKVPDTQKDDSGS